ncbi:hypothetical protein W822_20475 [Advenella kashmirensis W13003]|uniref:Pentapeptide MXKDX repeat protein n=1 Tax=Advenella kashmirensis W13003 TaxID=1424334 RepID=V8QNR5_9BURK|nr:hypothetical protein [Advenella kashmirensis]ETF00960.1 hypothetical protein W822_20475 [Advenella kashmirensis W13003]
MNRMTISAMAGVITLALGMQSALAANTQMNTDSKIDQKPMQQGSTTKAPTPGWEKLSKSKKWKSTESGTGMQHSANMKTDSNVVPEHKAGSGMTMSHEAGHMSKKEHDGKMKSGAAKPATQNGAMPMQQDPSMKSDSNVVPVKKGEMPKPGM